MRVILKLTALALSAFFGWIAVCVVVGFINSFAEGFFDAAFVKNDQDIYLMSGVLLSFSTFFVFMIGDYYYDLIASSRRPSDREKEIIEDVKQRLSEAYYDKLNRSMPRIRWRVLDDNSYNAMAYGRKTIAISRSLISLIRDNGLVSGEQLIGVAAHEMGHIEHKDTLYPLVVGSLLWPIHLVRIVFIPIAIIPIVGPIMLSILINLSAFAQVLPWMLLGFSSKPSEYAADRFSARLVGSQGLTDFFDLIAPLDIDHGNGVLGHYLKSHPPVELRRNKIQIWSEHR